MAKRAVKSSLPGSPSLTQIYSDMYGTIDGGMQGSVLAGLLSSLREAGLDEALPAAEDEPVMRLMNRLGWLEGLSGAEKGKRAEDIIREFSEQVDRMPSVLSVVFRIFSDGLYGVMPNGVCANPPRCGVCPLTKICAYYNAPPKLSARERILSPEERLRQNGEGALSDEELLSLVIGGGKTNSSSNSVAAELLNRYGSLRRIAQSTASELESYASVTRPAALRILSAFALSVRMSDEKRRTGPSVRCGKDFYDLFHERLRDLRQESFWVVLLDQRNRIVRDEQISKGSLSAALVHPREVFAPAIRESAVAIAIVHNHPSGDPTPSPEDKDITRRLAETARIVGIRLLDHVIIGEGRFTSFVDESLM